MISNDEAFAKADFEARQIEARIERKLTPEEYSEFVWWFMNSLKYEAALRPQNPFE